MSEIMAIVEAMIFVADEPLTIKLIAEVLDEERDTVHSRARRIKKRIRNARRRFATQRNRGRLADFDKNRISRRSSQILKNPTECETLARITRNARRHRLQTTRDSSRNSGNSRRAVGFGDQNASGQKTDRRQRQKRSRRATDAIRHVEGFFDPIRFEGFVGTSVYRGF